MSVIFSHAATELHLLVLTLPQRKTKGKQLNSEIVSAPFHTFFALFHTFSHFSEFSPRMFLKIKAFAKENKTRKAKPFCTLVVARLSSSNTPMLASTKRADGSGATSYHASSPTSKADICGAEIMTELVPKLTSFCFLQWKLL